MNGMVSLLGSAWWPPILQTAIGGLIGAFGAIAGGSFGSWFTWQKERQSVAAAFAAEVQGIVDLIYVRQVLELIPLGYKFAIEPNFPVFEANIGKIGLLPTELARKVAGFYNYAAGIFLDVRTINNDEITEGTRIRFTQRLTKNIETMLMEGKALVPELQKEAARSWLDCLQPTS
jgi:hypothetical protein